MGHLFSHSYYGGLIEQVAQSFKGGRLFVSKDEHLIFVCGGTSEDCVRTRFMHFVTNGSYGFHFFLAEDAQKDYFSSPEPDFLNIAVFEDLLGSLSDCILLFPESPGSFAEIGYFSLHKELRRITFPVCDQERQGADSFLSLGPIQLLNEHSMFRSALMLSYDQPNFDLIIGRLTGRLKRMTLFRRHKFHFSTFRQMKPKQRMFLLSLLVSLFEPITFDDIPFLLKRISTSYKNEDIKLIMSFMIGAKLLYRSEHDHDYFVSSKGFKPFLEFENENFFPNLRLDIINGYQQHDDVRAKLIEQSHGS